MASFRRLGLFPFCVAKTPVEYSFDLVVQPGPNTPFPLFMPTNVALAFFYRVKWWKFELNYTYERDLSVSAADGPWAAGSYHKITPGVTPSGVSQKPEPDGAEYGFASYIGRADQSLEKEKYMIRCDDDVEFWSWTFGVNIPYTQEFKTINPNTGSVNEGTFEVSRGFNMQTNYDFQQQGFVAPFAKEAGKDGLWAAFRISFGSWLSDSTVYETETNIYDLEEEVSFEMDFVGYRQKIPIKRKSAEGIEENIQDARIYPMEFWEYDPGDGLGPIYNKFSGAQVREFP